jgi:hypothetical protein
MNSRRLLAVVVSLLALTLSSCDLRVAFEWVYTLPIQCGNPWDAPASVPPLPRGSQEEIYAVRDYLASQGIQVEELGFIELGGASCLACACSRGDLLVVRADPREAWKLATGQGFSYLFNRPGQRWLAKSLLQCGDVWQRPGQPQEEEAAFRAWAAEQGIAVSLFGLVEPAYLPPVCFGCGCPRGDRALVGVPDPKSEQLLRADGFTGLFD